MKNGRFGTEIKLAATLYIHDMYEFILLATFTEICTTMIFTRAISLDNWFYDTKKRTDMYVCMYFICIFSKLLHLNKATYLK